METFLSPGGFVSSSETGARWHLSIEKVMAGSELLGALDVKCLLGFQQVGRSHFEHEERDAESVRWQDSSP